MLFDVKPKERREELFGRDEELNTLHNYVSNLIGAVVYGIRRIGKTSLVKVYCNEVKNCIYVDARKLYETGNVSVDAFIEEITRNNKSMFDEIEIDLKIIRAKRSKKREKLSKVLEMMDEKGYILVIDEAQNLRTVNVFTNVFAWALDNLRNLKIVFSGSEVGVLEKYLGLKDPESPLYGRGLGEIKLERFDEETSMEFLRKGFEELGMNVKEDELREAAETFGGIVGWLTLYGSLRASGNDHTQAMENVKETASNITAKEINEFLKLRPTAKRYCCILRAVALGLKAWKDIKKYCQDDNDKNFTEALKKLIDYSFIVHVNNEYLLTDPISKEAILKICQ